MMQQQKLTKNYNCSLWAGHEWGKIYTLVSMKCYSFVTRRNSEIGILKSLERTKSAFLANIPNIKVLGK